MLRFIDRHLPLVFGLILFSLPVGAICMAACNEHSTPEEKMELDTRYTEYVKEDLMTLSPRPGVECYILRGNRPTEPRTMSCIVLPDTMATGQ